MALTIETAMNWIHSRSLFGARPGLDRVEELLRRIGNPEAKVPIIHIAGTNGKGSTLTYLRCMLEEKGLKVGTFISPFVIHFNEQIAINGKYISNEAIIKYVEKFRGIVQVMDKESAAAGITEFETITVIALDYFFDEKVDIAIIEVGMGGLLDSTNVVCPLLTAITTIGKDHTDILGNTIEEIAFHKAGIIKENIPVVTGNIIAPALNVIKEVAEYNQSKTYCYGETYEIEHLHPDEEWGEVFNFQGDTVTLPNVKVPLIGQHQTENAAVAIQLFIIYCQQRRIDLVIEHVYKGLAKAHWPARMERINIKPLIVLDGAHNEHAVERLAANLKNQFAGGTIHILFSALSTKNFSQMIGMLKEVPNVHLYLTTFDNAKAVELPTLKAFVDQRTNVVNDWQAALEELSKKITASDLLLVTGSLYFMSQVRQLLICKGPTS